MSFQPLSEITDSTERNASSSNKSKFNILVGATGSVATIKLEQLLQCLSTICPQGVRLRVILSEHAQHFATADSLKAAGYTVYTDADEWSTWQSRGDPVLHIELRRWADVFLIAPLDANTLAKLAGGLCDNLLTCVARAWDMGRKPIVVCPAMNTMMWEHPLTEEHVIKLRTIGYQLVPPVKKTLICGDSGMGAMAEVDTIAGRVKTEWEKFWVALCEKEGENE